MHKRTAAGAAAFIIAAIVLGLSGVVVAGSSALANDGNCGPGDLCLWEHANMSGGRWDASESVGNYANGEHWWGTNQSINDQASSARSRYSWWSAKLCEHSYYRGRVLKLYSGGEIPNLADYGFNDIASSNYI